MARLHMKFRSINKRTVRAAQALFDAKPWSGTDEEQQSKYERFARDVSEVYGIPQPTLTITAESDVCGLVAPNTIVLNKFSVISLFHSFRAHMQYTGAVDTAFYDRNDAQAWACSLFYTCRPILFRKQVRLGRIAGVRADDLLTSATLSARQAEVDEAFAGVIASSYTGQEFFDGDDEDDDSDGLDDVDLSEPMTSEEHEATLPVPTVAEMEQASSEAQQDEERLRYTIGEAAAHLNVSQSTVRNMISDGRLSSEREGRRVFVLIEAS